MEKISKRLLSFAMALMMVLSLIPFNAMEVYAETIQVTDTVSYETNDAGWVEIDDRTEFNLWFHNSGDDSQNSAGDYYVQYGLTTPIEAKLILTSDIDMNVGGFIGLDDSAPAHNIIIDLNGHTLTYNTTEYEKPFFTVYNSTVTLMNGKLIGTGAASNKEGGMLSVFNGNLTLRNMEIQRVKTAAESDMLGGVLYASNSTVLIENSTLTGGEGRVSKGGVLYATSGSNVTLNNTTLSGGVAVNAGNTYISGGSLTLNKSTITGGHAYYYGGNLYSDSSAQVVMNDSIVTQGAASRVEGYTSLHSRGSNLYVNSGSFTMYGGEITDGGVDGGYNKTYDVNGASLHVRNGATFHMYGGLIRQNNVTKLQGVGALFAATGSITIHEGSVEVASLAAKYTIAGYVPECATLSEKSAEGVYTVTVASETAGTPVAPTCTAVGYTPYTCAGCEAVYHADFVTAAGHTAVAVPGKAATCTETGYTEGSKCSACEEDLAGQVTTEALGHNLTLVEGTAPTCEADGIKSHYACSRCDVIFADAEGETVLESTVDPATDHNYTGEVTEAPTCTEKGLMTYTCQNDSTHTYTQEIPATGHAYQATVTAPTCTEAGYTTYTCACCGDSYTDTVVEATGHDHKATVTAPTCDAAGYTTYTCSNCEHTYTDNVEEALGHDWEYVKTDPEASCTDTGLNHYTCKNDATHTKTEVVEATGHSAGTPVKDNIVEATCTTDGSYDMVTYCTKCGGELDRETTVVPALGHTDGAATVENSKLPTCTEDGSYDTVVRCTVCGVETSRVTTTVAATGHTEETVAAVASGCETTGLTEGKKCSTCGETLVAQEEVAATGHAYDEGTVTKAPGCESTGTKTYTCQYDAAHYYTEEIAATGHTEGEAVTENEVAATCTATGSYDTVVYCSVCDAEISRVTETVAVIGHSYDAGVRTEATTTADAYTTYTCTVCGHSYVETHEGTKLPDTSSYVAKIGDAEYGSLDEAITAANAMSGDVVIEIYGKVEYTDASPSLGGTCSSISFVGKTEDAEISITRNGTNGYISGTGSAPAVSFEDLILSKAAGGYATDAGFMNCCFTVYRVASVSYTNCTFPNGAAASGCPTNYTGCTFGKSYDKYALWAYGNAEIVVDDCVFDCDRGIKMYAEGAAKTTELTVTNSDFSQLTGKPAIVLTYGESVTLDGNTYSDTGAFELDLDGAPNGTTLTADAEELAKITCINDDGACGVLVDGKIYTTVADASAVATEGSTVTLLHDSTEDVELAEGVILDKNGHTADNVTVAYAMAGSGTEADPYQIATAKDLFYFAEKVNDGTYTNVYAVLTADIDLEQEDWTSIGTSANPFTGTFDGNGKTISNLWCYERGLFGYTSTGNYVDSGSNGRATIKNLTVENATVINQSTSAVGGIVGQAKQNTVLDNVKLTGEIQIFGYGYVGGMVGQGYVHVNNCHVDGLNADSSEINAAYWAVGGIVGHAGSEGGSAITGCSVKNVTIYSQYYGAGAIAGVGTSGPIEDVSADSVQIDAQSTPDANGALVGCNYEKVTGNSTVTNVTLTVDGTVVELPQDMAAQVGATKYANLQAAINAADGAEVIVLQDVVLTETLTIPAGMTVTLNLNGKTISQEKACTASYSMIENKGNLTITGEGKISFTDTGAGDSTFGWGSYTLANYGTLVVENGTIENLSTQNPGNGQPNVHMYCAIQQGWGAVSTTINGGTISTPTYRSVRINTGALIINGGTFVGQVWVQPNQGNATLTITDGSFAPAGNDGSSVFMTNVGENYTVSSAAISGGIFNGKIGCSDASALAGVITGGAFTATAKAGTNEALLARGFVFTENSDGTYGVAEDPTKLYIDDLAELKAFRDAVNAGNNYQGITVLLTADIDLAGEDWTPIGTSAAPFCGMFDGQGHTISNLTINGDKTYVSGGTNDNYKGLFGYMKGGNTAGIKNLTIQNASVTGCLYVGAILGRSYTGGIIENCNVVGSVQIDGYSYVGGIVGRHEYSANSSKVSIFNCHVDGAALTRTTSFVNADYAVSYVGGIVGFLAEGNYIVDDCSVKNINVSGVYGVGGVSGIGHYGNQITDATVDSVTVTSNGNNADSARTDNVGLVVGATQGTASQPTVITAAVTNTTGSVTYTDGTTSEVETLYGTSMTNEQAVTNWAARIGSVYYEDALAAIAAAQDGEIVTLLADITATDAILIGKSITLDGNGHTITSSATRVIRFSESGINVTVNDLNLVSNAVRVETNDIRGFSVDAVNGTTVTLNNCSVDFTDASATDWSYAINQSGTASSGNTINVNGGTYEGANVVNIWGTDHTVVVDGAELTSLYPASEYYHGVCVKLNQTSNVTATVKNATFNGTHAVAIESCETDTTDVSENNIDNTKYYNVKIGSALYYTLADAFAAAQDGDTVVLLSDEEIVSDLSNAGSGVCVVPDGISVTLDLNGNDVVVTDNSTGNFSLFYILGELTVKNGNIELTSTNDRDWNAMSAIFHNRGGVLNVESGTYTNHGGTDMAFAIDNSANSYGDATLNFNGGEIYSSYIAVRMRMADPTLNGNPGNGESNVKVTGGKISGGKYGIWGQITNASALQLGALDITGGTVEGTKGAVLMTADGNDNIDVTISGDAYINGTISGDDADYAVTGGTFTEPVAEGFCADGYIPMDNGDGTYGVKTGKYVAKIGQTKYETLAEALSAANDGDTIELIYADGDAPIVAKGEVTGGKTVTITGTAAFDWSKGWLFVGRGSNSGDGTLIFENANITSVSSASNSALGIHVSAKEAGEANKNNGTVVMKNSNIELDFLINKGTMTVDGGSLIVYNGFSVGGRPGTETESGEASTAYMNLVNGAYLTVVNHNGMGVGYEDLGVMNVNSGSTFECTLSFLVTEKGQLNVDGGTVIVAGTLTNLGTGGVFKDATVKINKLDNDAEHFLEGTVTIQVEDATASGWAIRVKDGVVLNDSYIKATNNATVRLLGSATFNGGFECAYLQGSSAGVGGTVTIEDGTVVKATYGVEFSKDYVLNGGKILLAGGNADGKIWGCVFQSGTYEINTDIEVDGSGATAPIHFTKADVTITSEITQKNPGGEVIYLANSNATVDGGVLSSTTGVHVNTGSTLKLVNGAKINASVTNNTAIEMDLSSSINGTKLAGAGTITIDAAAFNGTETQVINADTKGFTGTVEVINSNSADYAITDSGITVVTKKVASVTDAEGNVTQYTSLPAALKALTAGSTLTLLSDIEISEDWDNRNTGAKTTVPVTIDGNGYTLKFTGTILDGYNYLSVFRFQADTTVKNLTVDMSEAVSGWGNRLRAISTSADLTVDNCTFIGNTAYTNTKAIIFGEGSGAAIGDVEITVTNSTFQNWTRGVGDNENGGDVKSVTITGNTFQSANVIVSAAENVTFTDNTMDNGWVNITSYSEPNALAVTASGNTLEDNDTSVSGKINYINAADVTNVQDGFLFPVAEINGTKYASLDEAYAAAEAGDTIVLVDNLTLSDVFTIDKAITLDLGGYTLTGADGKIVLNVKADTTIQNGTIQGNKSGTSSGLIDIYANLTMNGVTVETSKIIALRFKSGGCTAVLTDCQITGDLKGYGGSVWEIHSGTYTNSTTATSDHLNGSAAVYGGTFYYEIAEEDCAPGYVVVNNGDGTWTVKYAPACFVDTDNDGILDEGEPVYGNLDQVFAKHQEGTVNVVLTDNIVANGQVDTDADAHYNITTNVAEGVTVDFLYSEDWNYVQKMTIGENITLNVPYLVAWTDLDVYGTVNTGYAYFNAADVTIHEGAVLNAATGDATVQVKNGTTLTVNGTVNTSTLNVWVNDSQLIVSGENAQLNASWIDIWDGTPTVTVENGATLSTDSIKVSRGGTITVDAATLDADEMEVGHSDGSVGTVTVINNGIVTNSELTAIGSTISGPEGMNVTSGVEGYVVVYEDGVYSLSEIVATITDAEGNITGYASLAAAINAVKNGDTVTMLQNVEADEPILITKSITLDGANFTLSSTADRAINVNTDGEVTIKNLTIECSAATERAVNVIQKPATVNLDNVTVPYAKYAVNVASSAGAATVNIANSNITGYAALNLTGANGSATVTDSTLTGKGISGETNQFATIAIQADNVTVNVTGGKLIAEGDTNESILQIYSGNTGANVLLDTELVYTESGIVGLLDSDNNAIILRAEYADTILADGYTYQANGTELIDVKGAVIAMNVQTGEVYADLESALNEAVSGQTVQLNGDVAGVSLAFVRAGVTLDLNGYTLETDYLIAGFTDAHVVDSSEGNTGLLKVDPTYMNLSVSNKAMMITTADGYRFVDIEVATGIISATNGAYRIGYAVRGDVALLCQLMAQYGPGEIKVEYRVRIDWTTASGDTTYQTFCFSEELSKEYAAMNGDGRLEVTVSGLENATNIQFTSQLVAVDEDGREIVIISGPTRQG